MEPAISTRLFDNLGNRPGNILWRDSTTGNVAIWYMSGGNISSTGSLGIVAPSWTIIGSDNHGNIFWRDTSGTVAVWQVTPGPTVAASGVLGANVPSNWTIAGLGDFYGDGNAGILWRDGNTGTVAIWKVQGTQLQSATSLGVVPSAWSIVQTGDYNGDGTSDILWVDNSGNLAIWFLSAGHISSTAGIGNIGTSWIVQSANSE